MGVVTFLTICQLFNFYFFLQKLKMYYSLQNFSTNFCQIFDNKLQHITKVLQLYYNYINNY